MKIQKKHFLNYSILIPYMILSIFGLIMVYSTTSASQALQGLSLFRPVLNQTIFWVLGLGLIYFIYQFKLSFLRNNLIMMLVIIAEMVMLFGARFLAEPVNGAYGWWKIVGSFALQPAEYLKIIIIWFLASVFSRRQDKIEEFDYQALIKGPLLPRRLADIPRVLFDWRYITVFFVGMLVVMPDLGNATIVVLTVIIMILASGIAYRWFGIILGAIVVGSAALLGTINLVGVDVMANVPVFGYIAKRFSAFFNPFLDAENAGHQLVNSYYAISNGGWFGLGLGNSIEKKGYLPEAETDFVFSIVMEELGLIGASLILALLFFLILRIILVGIKARDPFNAMMAIGIGGMLLVQTFVNVGGISGLIPSTGVTFPFLSQGGNSLLVISVAIGFVLNIDAHEKRNEFQEELASRIRE